jgi:hypothetical protein
MTLISMKSPWLGHVDMLPPYNENYNGLKFFMGLARSWNIIHIQIIFYLLVYVVRNYYKGL